MKKLALIAAVAAIAIPATAQAGRGDMHKETNHMYDGSTKVVVDTKMVTTTGTEQTWAIPQDGQTRTVDLVNGGKLRMDGSAAYLMTNNGWKYSAPNGEYTSNENVSYFTENGVVLYAQPNAGSQYVIETDVQDHDKDGYINDVDVNVEKTNR